MRVQIAVASPRAPPYRLLIEPLNGPRCRPRGPNFAGASDEKPGEKINHPALMLNAKSNDVEICTQGANLHLAPIFNPLKLKVKLEIAFRASKRPTRKPIGAPEASGSFGLAGCLAGLRLVPLDFAFDCWAQFESLFGVQSTSCIELH